MCDVVTVIAGVCNSVKLLQFPVVTSYKCSLNPVINPNPVCSYAICDSLCE
jgi:hypothetical protein